MSARAASPARELLTVARTLVDRSSPGTAGLWPRAAALLTRQALEIALKTYWSYAALGAEECSSRAQLLCLGRYLSDEPLARRTYQVWASLSRACHHHPYELAPTREELLGWCEGVGEVVERTEEQIWGRRANSPAQ